MDTFVKVLVPCLAVALAGLGHASVFTPEVLAAIGVLTGALAGLFHNKPGK